MRGEEAAAAEEAGHRVGGTRAWLRMATAEAHERLHHLPDFAALAAGALSRTGYVALLRRLLGFHLAVEACADAGAEGLRALGIEAAARRRTPLILADLAHLGQPVAAGERVARPSLRAPDASGAWTLGCLYVAEGSALGGRVLARALDPMLGGAGTAEGRRFLLGHGPRQGEMWRELCAALEACGTDPGRRAALLDGAEAAFAAFAAWFGAADDAAPEVSRRGG